ncbi:unnamed protein product, partial [marine sediment metagenome]
MLHSGLVKYSIKEKSKYLFGFYCIYIGTALIMEAKMQVMNFHDNMEKYDLSGGGDYVMLWALSDLGNTLEQSHLLYSTSNRY